MHTVHYTSNRAEIWRWYWRSWARPNGLWRIHVLFGIGIALLITLASGTSSFELSRFLLHVVVGILGCVILLPLWPQIRFKRAQRALTIDANGLSTQIGTLSGSVPWKQVRSVEEDGDAIAFIGSSNNAMIVPARAFASVEARQEFLDAALRWHSAAST